MAIVYFGIGNLRFAKLACGDMGLKIPQLVPDTGPGRGMRRDDAPIAY